MDQLFSWAWQGVFLIGVLMTIWRVIPVAFDAWKSGNLIAGIVKTVGPVLSIGVIAIGGYMVIRESLAYIASDAQSSGFYNTMTSWGNGGSASFDSAADDFGSYFESFKSEYNNAVTEAGREDATIENTLSGAPENPQSPGGNDIPAPAPTKVVGVHTAPMDTTNVLTPAEIQRMAERNAELGRQAREEAERSGNPASLNGNSENLMFGTGGGGGPSTIAADQAVTTVAGGVYVVQRGDDLSKISLNAYGTTAHAMTICRANALRNCNVVAVGKKLVIPAINP